MKGISSLLLTLSLVTGVITSSCNLLESHDCKCAPPPKEPVTPAALSKVDTWYLNEVNSGGQLTRTNAIKDRYSIQFRTDGTYVQTLLADGTAYNGTWMLMGADNRILHLTDHKGAAQEYSVEGVSAESLFYGRLDKAGQLESYLFKSTR
ncbi:hypothetical protein DNI29_18315 [Hymenobacter sediminis]|uniref:hypothetical protein n=1 Tax=Hymenobacter sediminis TaxID=2218621 RepID=UPI000F4F923F|nr:hypothetical protein [Hymenobacter sediminis]RPD45339.1 hypothetical protein DNI29_18315 [Hymenobacter sediminis]